jgi:hypothetical protein
VATAFHLTVGDVAARFRCDVWQVRRLFTRGLLPEPGRVGAYRVIPESDLPTIKAALVKAGYLTTDATEAVPGAN